MKKVLFMIFILLSFSTLAVNADDLDDFGVVEETLEVQNDTQIQPQTEENEEQSEDILNDDDSDENDEDTDYSDFLYNENDDGIYLNTSSEPKSSLKNKRSKIKGEEVNCDTQNDFHLSPQNLNLYDRDNEYSKTSTSFSREKQVGNMSFGATYDSSITPNELSQTRTLFTKYQKDKLMLNTSYKNNTFSSFGQQFSGTFSFSPEYKLNNHLSLQSIYSRNILDKSNKNEVVFSLKPFNDDRMNFNVGASQINYDNGAPTRSQFKFSTKINF